MLKFCLLILFQNQFPIEVEYISLRPAKWEETALIEEINEKRNLGGLVFIYYKNKSKHPVHLREWYLNDRESGHFRLAGDIAWDRRYSHTLQPGETAVQEISGVSNDFQIGKPANFKILNNNWQTTLEHNSIFEPEKFRITSIVFDSTLTSAIVHIKSFIPDPAQILTVSVENRNIEKFTVTSPNIEKNGHVVVNLKFEKSFTPGELCLIKVETEVKGKQEIFYSHRNAYPDFFPNGTWSIDPPQYKDAHLHHLNTMVKGGKSTDSYFAQEFEKEGFKTMTHTGLIPNIDMIRDLKNHPAVVCWYIQDEPDWLHHPQSVFAAHQMTKVYSQEKPTMITLCRNVKFFEYAFIPDIPCQDHYSVTAPTSSKWPYVYGTRLEETGFYTRDLKYASEPKPVWVWTQGVHLWDERPKMPLPTPDELGAQLFFNLGQGAKGNLWFTFQEEAGRLFPQTKKALQNYSRIIRLTENELLASDPLSSQIISPQNLDVAPLISSDQLTVFLTNLDYQIHDSSYIWNPLENFEILIKLPDWFDINSGFEIQPENGIKELLWTIEDGVLKISVDEIKMGKIFIFSSDMERIKTYLNRFDRILQLEKI